MKISKVLFVSALATLMGVAAFTGVKVADVNKEEPVTVEAAASTTKNTDATCIYYKDEKNWCFRSLHFYDVTFSDGYTNSDFETYLTGFYGSKISSWSIQGTTRGWGLNGGTAKDYMICDGGSQQTHNFVFPWWIASFTFQIVNSGNWLCNWGVHSDWGIHTRFDLKVDGTSVSHNEGSMSSYTYDFPAVTISKVAVDSNSKTVIAGASIPSETSSIYDKYPNGSSSPSEPGITVDGYLFDSWYTNQNLSTPFTKKFYTSDATIYAKYNECPTVDIYVDAYNWSNLYLYTFETINQKKVEYYGPFPGKHLTISDPGLKYNGGMLQKVAVPYTTLANAKFVYSDGTDSNKSKDYSLVANNYYWHNGTSWTQSSSHIYTGASFVFDLNDARLKVSSSGDVKDFSICGLEAKTWVDRYDGLNGSAQTYVNSATIYTYKDASSSQPDTNVTFASIITTLRSRYSGVQISQMNAFGNSTNTAASTATAIVIAVAAIGTVGAFLTIKKKKIHK